MGMFLWELFRWLNARPHPTLPRGEGKGRRLGYLKSAVDISD